MHNRNVPRRRAGPERAGPAGTIGEVTQRAWLYATGNAEAGVTTLRNKPLLQLLEHPIDAFDERGDVGRVDRREHADPQLVAAELAVGLGVDDAVGAQRLRHGR